MPDKALPFGVDRVALWENNLGSWRGHMDAIRTYVFLQPPPGSCIIPLILWTFKLRVGYIMSLFDARFLIAISHIA